MIVTLALKKKTRHFLQKLTKSAKIRDHIIDPCSNGASSGGSFSSSDLSFNQLSAVSEGAFANLDSLEELDLHHNQISCVDRNSFKSLEALRYL
jgi:hypothetical protein